MQSVSMFLQMVLCVGVFFIGGAGLLLNLGSQLGASAGDTTPTVGCAGRLGQLLILLVAITVIVVSLS